MSIYASTPGIGDHGDPEHLGQPWIYRGSHILPADTDPRGGHIGLAEIPSHITRDGRDDAPEDGRPWPWARLSVVEDGVVIDIVINPAQARHLGEQLTTWADRADGKPAATDRIRLDDLTSDALDALYDQLDAAEREATATATAAAHMASLILDRAERAEARLSHLQASSEAAGRLLTRTTDERDRLAVTLREVLSILLPTRNDHGTIVGYEPPYPITPAAIARWRSVLPETACTCGEPTGDDEDAAEARKGWLHSRSCAAVKGAQP